MLLWLTCEGSPKAINWQAYLDELDNLGEAGYKRDHAVFADRAVLAEILALPNLSRRARAYFLHIQAKFSTIAGIRHEVTPIYVSASCYAEVTDGDSHIIPLSAFANLHSAVRANLVCEHMYDFHVLSFLASMALANWNMNSTFQVSFVPVSGGGGGTHLTLLTYQLNADSIGICVVDSDKSHPGDAYGSTAVSCSRAFKHSWRWRLHVLAARELENVVPPEIWREGIGEELFAFDEAYDDRWWGVYGFADSKESTDSLCRYFEIGPGHGSYTSVQASLRELSTQGVPNCASCLREFECAGAACCNLGAGFPKGLQSLAAWIERGRALPKTTRMVRALEALLKDLVKTGIAPRFRVT